MFSFSSSAAQFAASAGLAITVTKEVSPTPRNPRAWQTRAGAQATAPHATGPRIWRRASWLLGPRRGRRGHEDGDGNLLGRELAPVDARSRTPPRCSTRSFRRARSPAAPRAPAWPSRAASPCRLRRGDSPRRLGSSRPGLGRTRSRRGEARGEWLATRLTRSPRRPRRGRPRRRRGISRAPSSACRRRRPRTRRRRAWRDPPRRGPSRTPAPTSPWRST